MTILAERDSVIQERNIALSEKKAAMAERDMAILQRDAAIAERNTAIIERDNAITALEYARESGLNINGGANRIPHQHHHNQHLPPPLQPQLANDPYNHSREMHVTAAYPISTATEGVVKMQKVKRPRTETKLQPSPSPKKTPNKSRKSKRGSGGGDEDLNKQGNKKHHNQWKDQDLGLNQVAFDESTMPAPVCSCTGKYQQCYKWGNGGWQSACCTMTLSMYPLPVMPNKRHARVGGRKMSGSAFTKLLSRLAANGHELSVPVDLKDHWSKHGTNRYITIK